MKNLALFFVVFLFVLFSSKAEMSWAQSSPASGSSESIPEIRIHYLGHSAFILLFDNGVSVLTDYGESKAYGLNSPVYDLNAFQPGIVIYSHHHADHDRRTVFANAKVLDGQDLSINQIDFKAVPVAEKREGDNFGYLIAYKGYIVFFAGDSQGDILNIEKDAEVQKRLKSRLPEKIDLLFVPIDFIGQIYKEVPDYIRFLHPGRVIPMHYWSPSVKSEFLNLYRNKGEELRLIEDGSAEYELFISKPGAATLEIISLTPAAYVK